MAVHQLTLETLNKLYDGRVAAAFDLKLKQLVLDLEDRPQAKQARKLTLEVTLTPMMADGELESAAVDFQVLAKSPGLKTKAFDMQFRRGGVLVFNDLSEDNANQRTLDESNPEAWDGDEPPAETSD